MLVYQPVPVKALSCAMNMPIPELAALDLLVEAEHGPESAAILVTHSREVAEKALEVLPEYISELPTWRQDFVNNVLGKLWRYHANEKPARFN